MFARTRVLSCTTAATPCLLSKSDTPLVAAVVGMLTALYCRAPWRNFFRDFIATFTSDPYKANDDWKTITGPSDRSRGDTPAGSGTVTPNPAAVSDPANPSGEQDIDPSNPLRAVPRKKANQPFLVHQKWKEEQELRRRKAKQDSNASDGKNSNRDAGDRESLDISGFLGFLVAFFRYAIMATAITMAAGQFVAGDAFWGYRGKYLKLRTYLPVRVGTFCHIPELVTDCAVLLVPRTYLLAAGACHV